MEPTAPNTELRRIESQAPAPASQTEIGPVGGSSALFKAACLVVVLWGVEAARPVLLPIFIAALLAFLMAPVHRLLHDRLRVPDALAVVVAALALLSPIGAIAYLLARQGQSFVNDFPRLMHSAQQLFERITALPLVQRLTGGEGFSTSDLTDKITSSAGQGLGLLVGGLATIASFGSQGLLIFIFAVMMLGSRRHLRRAGEKIVERSRALRSANVLDQVVDLVQRFLVARMAIVVIIGALSAVALSLWRVQYGIFLGALIGLTTLIPAIGFLLALIPTLIVAAVTGHSVGSLLGILASLLVVNSIDNYYLTPKMVGNRVNINALTSFIGLFAGGALWGVWGMFLSVPVLGVLRIVFSAVPGLQPWGELLADTTAPRRLGEKFSPRSRATH